MNLTGKLKQTCVHWTSPVPDGRGGFTFATERERVCRWDEVREVQTRQNGETFVSAAVVYLSVAVAEDDYLFLGEQYTLPSNHTNPATVSGAYPVRRVTKTVSVSGTESIWMAYL